MIPRKITKEFTIRVCSGVGRVDIQDRQLHAGEIIAEWKEYKKEGMVRIPAGAIHGSEVSSDIDEYEVTSETFFECTVDAE